MEGGTHSLRGNRVINSCKETKKMMNRGVKTVKERRERKIGFLLGRSKEEEEEERGFLHPLRFHLFLHAFG